MYNFNILEYALMHYLNVDNIQSYIVNNESIVVKYNRALKDNIESIVLIETLKQNLNDKDVDELLSMIQLAQTAEINDNIETF
jgi:hypothetical protein